MHQRLTHDFAAAPVHTAEFLSKQDGKALTKAAVTSTRYRVRDDAMLDAGISPGDVVNVEKRAGVQIGDIVLAIVDNQFTLKYLARDNRGYFLQPANRAYPSIRPAGALEIFGVLTSRIDRSLVLQPH